METLNIKPIIPIQFESPNFDYDGSTLILYGRAASADELRRWVVKLDSEKDAEELRLERKAQEDWETIAEHSALALDAYNAGLFEIPACEV